MEDPKPNFLACNGFRLCGVTEPQLLPSDDRELVKEVLLLRLWKDSWDRIRGIFESSGCMVIEEREVHRYLCVFVGVSEEEERGQLLLAHLFTLCTQLECASSPKQRRKKTKKCERGRKKKHAFCVSHKKF